MLHGVLNMPPELWSGSPIDVMQRHSRYVQASQYIDELTEQLDEAREETIRTREFMYHGFAVAQAELTAVRELRDMLAEEVGQLKSRLTQTMGAVTISRNGYVQELEEQRDRLAEALRELCIALLTDKSPDITDLLNKAGAAMAAVNYSTAKKSEP